MLPADKQKTFKTKGFSLVELLVVIVIIGILSVVSYVAIQRARVRAMNERMLNDLIAISSALEDYRRDHDLAYPMPQTPDENPDTKQNVLCYRQDTTYSHDCAGAVFRQGMIDSQVLSKRYLREVPTDPRTNSRYAYGVTNDGKYFQVAGIYEREDGTYEARTAENLAKGFELPSLLRSYDGANFVADKKPYLPYSPDHLVLTAKLGNTEGDVTVENGEADGVLREGAVIRTGVDGQTDIYFSDGSVTHLDFNSELTLTNMTVVKNDKEGTVTQILLRLNAGKIWSKVVRLAKGSEFNIETTSAIAGVRGTEFGVEVERLSDTESILHLTMLAGGMAVGPPENPESTLIEEVTPLNAKTADFGSSGELVGSVRDLSNSEVADLVHERYGDLPLHTGIVPHVLWAREGDGEGSMRVRNANFFVNQVNRQWEETLGLPTDTIDRRIRMNRVAVYNAQNTPEMTFVMATSDVSGQPKEAYQITGLPLGLPLVLRFEDWRATDITDRATCNALGNHHWSGGDCFEVVGASAFSSPPVRIDTDTDLEEIDLYPNEGVDKPALALTAPQFTSAGENASLALRLTQLPQEAVSFTYGILVDQGSCVIDMSFPQTVDASPPNHSVDIPFSAPTAAGESCRFSATVLLPGGRELTGSTETRVVSAGQRLVLVSPPDGASMSHPSQVSLSWKAISPPTGATFDVTISPPGETLNVNSSSYVMTPPDANIQQTYTWQVQMKDASGNPIGDPQSATFTVYPAVTISFSGNVSDDAGNTLALSDTLSSATFATQSATVNLSFSADATRTYSWVAQGATLAVSADSLSASATIADLPENIAKTVSVTLSARDATTGNLLGESTKTITIIRGLPTLASISFADSPPVSVAQGGTLDLTTNLPALNGSLADNTPVTLSVSACAFSATPGTVNGSTYTAPTSTTATSAILTCTLSPGALTDYSIPAGGLPATLGVTINPAALPKITAISVVSSAISGSTSNAGTTINLSSLADVQITETLPASSPPSVSITNMCVWTERDTGVELSNATYTIPSQATTANFKCKLTPATFTNPNYIIDTTIESPNSQTIAITTPEQDCAAASGIWTGTTCLFGAQGACYNNGYWDGSACWVLGAAGASCDTACSTLTNPNTSTALGCVAEDWNDSGTICNSLSGGSTGNIFEAGFAPFYHIGLNRCYVRLITFSFTPPNTICNTLSDSGKKRICKCQ